MRLIVVGPYALRRPGDESDRPNTYTPLVSIEYQSGLHTDQTGHTAEQMPPELDSVTTECVVSPEVAASIQADSRFLVVEAE